MLRCLTCLLVFLALACCDAPCAVAQPNGWAMERITLKPLPNDKHEQTFEGLIRRMDDDVIELVQVRRRPDRPMYLLVRPIARRDVLKIQRLPERERELLEQRIHDFRNRTRILATRMRDIQFRGVGMEQGTKWIYQGPWFSLESTASEELTRRAIVRMEQVFAGYRSFLHPRREASDTLQVLLLGSSAERAAVLEQYGHRFQNPTLYDPVRNMIIAGADLSEMAAEMNRANKHHEQLRKKARRESRDLPAKLQQLSDKLKVANVPNNERITILTYERETFRKKAVDLARRIDQAEAKNAAQFDRLFGRLYHEAFHAYLQNYVVRGAAEDVPRWLNEGLAQVFETARLEADTLRLDTPDRILQEKLKAELQSEHPLSLSELLTATPDAFLAAHDAAVARSNQFYLVAWGVTHYLVFEKSLLDSEAMLRYLSGAGGGSAPEQFESLVGMPLEQFESDWRSAMLDDSR